MLGGQGQSFKTLNQYKDKVQDIKSPKLSHKLCTIARTLKRSILKKIFYIL